MYVSYRGPIETDYLISPEVIRRSRLERVARWWVRKRVFRYREDLDRAVFLPSVGWLFAKLRTRRPDVLILWQQTRASYVIAFIARKMGVRRILFYDELPMESGGLRKEDNGARRALMTRILGLWPPHTITPIALDAPSLDEKIEASRTHVPFVVARGRRRVKGDYCPGGVLRVLTVAKFREYKNLTLIPEALRKLADNELSEVEITLVGQATLEDEKELVERIRRELQGIPLKKHVVKTNLPPDEVQFLLSKADVFLLPSKRDRAPIAFLEAMGMGLVPIISDGVGTQSYLSHGKNGLIFNRDSASELASRLRALLAAKERVAVMGLAAYDEAAASLSEEKFLSQLGVALEKLDSGASSKSQRPTI